MKVAQFVIAAFAVSSAAVFANDSASKQSSGNGLSAAQNYSQSASSKSGDSNVSQVQQALKEKGFDPGAVDGKMGPHTQSALKQFQQSQQISASGEADQQTLAALGVQGASLSSGASPSDTTSPSGSASPSSSSSMSGNSSSMGSSSATPSSSSSSSTPSSSSGSSYPSSSGSSSDTTQQGSRNSSSTQ